MNMDPTNKDKERERDVDQWLDAGLSRYGKAEPRTGLESRVLANLQSERNRIASRRPWWWAAGAVAAAVAIVAVVWVGESSRKRHPGSVAETSTTTHHEEARRAVQPGPAPHAAHPANESAQRSPANRPIRDLVVASTPKLEQFPSPQPLSEQEQILMSYVAKYPEKAALIAQARAEALQRDREEELAEAAKDTME